MPLSTAIFSNLSTFACTSYNISGRYIGFVWKEMERCGLWFKLRMCSAHCTCHSFWRSSNYHSNIIIVSFDLAEREKELNEIQTENVEQSTNGILFDAFQVVPRISFDIVFLNKSLLTLGLETHSLNSHIILMNEKDRHSFRGMHECLHGAISLPFSSPKIGIVDKKWSESLK